MSLHRSVTCRVHQPKINQTRVTEIHIPGEIELQQSTLMNISSVIQSDTISLATKMCYQFSVFFFSCSKPVRLSLSYFFLIFFIISDNCMRSCTQTAAIAVAVAITVLLIILFACGVLTNKMCGITGKLLTLVLVKR